jgi:membrane-associated phospholipid phosphatase
MRPDHDTGRILGLGLLLLLLLFAVTGPLDHPTLTVVHGFSDPLLNTVGDLGNRLGNGVTLAIVSLGIWGIGYWKENPAWKSAGLYTLLAHGFSGLVAQILKHSLGRPRPRLMDTTTWEVGPSFASGLDSFPSGHTSASFSVATVLAFYFPAGRWLWFSLAAIASTSRIIKGSHFPTDVLGGILVGIGSGLVLIYARHQWKAVTAQAFVHGLPWLVTAFGLLWILVPHPGIELEPLSSIILALVLVMTGLSLRLWWIRKCNNAPARADFKVPVWPRLLMGTGLAFATGSIIVIGASSLAALIWWLGTPFLDPTHIQRKQGQERPFHSTHLRIIPPIWHEAMLGGGMFLLIFLTYFIRSL